MADFILFHLVPICCGFEKLSFTAEAKGRASPSARGGRGIAITFRHAVGEALLARASHPQDQRYDVITIVQLHRLFNLRGFSARDCPAILIKFMFDPGEQCVLVRCMADMTVKQDPPNQLSSWDYTSEGASRPTPVTNGIKKCRFCDDATICVGALKLQIVWVRPTLRPGEVTWDALRRRAELECSYKNERMDEEAAQGRNTMATSNNTCQTITKQDIINKTYLANGAGQTYIYTGITNRRPKMIAIKETRGLREGRTAAAEKEIDNIRTARHKHIVRYLGHHEPAKPGAPVEIYMELYTADVHSLNTEGRFNGTQLHKKMLHQILLALEFLAEKNICHRDVKPKNILHKIRGRLDHFALADLGESRVMGKGNTEVGTSQYKAPEIFELDKDAKPTMDVWSLAVTLMEIYPNKPFLNIASYQRDKVKEKLIEFGRSFPEYQPMTDPDPEKRASAKFLIHSLFKDEGLTVQRRTRTARMRAGMRA